MTWTRYLVCIAFQFPLLQSTNNTWVVLGLRQNTAWEMQVRGLENSRYWIYFSFEKSWIFIGRTDAETETLILWPPDVESWHIWKDPDAWKDWRREEKGMTEDEMAGWHHWLDGCESEWIPGVGDGQGALVCCSPWGHKELDTIERLNWTNCFPVRKMSLLSEFCSCRRASQRDERACPKPHKLESGIAQICTQAARSEPCSQPGGCPAVWSWVFRIPC